ncbi:TDP2 [Symbiodinium necroappetens]|uniref:TDP2 protein n=1 Tax=Symbiodinium necroappetens TaxID=1628268 RepID=A0A812UP27_9DINO|nr:TDP2 [Symbiodinium necroappetens]
MPPPPPPPGLVPRPTKSPATAVVAAGLSDLGEAGLPPGLAPRPTKAPTTAVGATELSNLGLEAALEARANKLRSVETRVRQRDGTLLVEQRGQHGFTCEVAGHEDSKPQYLEDQEHGLSRLSPKIFDEAAHRWRPTEAVSPEDAARLNEAQLSQRGLRLVTYNVWFSEYRQRIRAQALFGILSATKADIVCLQEVTPKFLSWLREEDFVRTNYALSDSVGTTLRGSELAYGVVLLVRRELHLSSLLLHELPSQMSRALLLASLPLPTHELRVATAHLESLNATQLRLEQLTQICKILTEDGQASSVFAGDMNFGDKAPEEQVLCQAGFVDSANCGHTMPFDDVHCQPLRIDRVFVSSAPGGSCRLLPGPCQRLGEKPAINPDEDVFGVLQDPRDGCPAADDEGETDPDMPTLVPVLPGEVPPRLSNLPSDHFGLLCDIELVQRKVAVGQRSLVPLEPLA